MKRTKRLFALLLSLCLFTGAASLSVFARPVRVVDNSGLLSSGDKDVLLQEADRISETYGMDVVILTADDLGGKSATAYADDYFDYGGYGLNEGRDGILLLVSMGERDWALSTRGRGIEVFSNRTCDYMAEQFLPYLSSGQYAQALALYLEYTEHYLQGGEAPADGMSTASRIMIAIGLALLLAFIIVMALKAQLNNAKPQLLAHSYISDFNLYRQSDVFLYSRVTRMARPKDNGGNGTHIGSSGASHGGSSGKF